jgi:hypothetical protein
MGTAQPFRAAQPMVALAMAAPAVASLQRLESIQRDFSNMGKTRLWPRHARS